MSGQRLETLLEESQSLSQEEKLSLIEHLLSDINVNKDKNALLAISKIGQVSTDSLKEELAKKCKEIHPALRPGNPELASKILNLWSMGTSTKEEDEDWEKLKKTIDANRDSDRKLYE